MLKVLLRKLTTVVMTVFVIDVTYDSWSDAEDKGRVGKEVLVPFEVSFMEYDARIMNLSR